MKKIFAAAAIFALLLCGCGKSKTGGAEALYNRAAEEIAAGYEAECHMRFEVDNALLSGVGFDIDMDIASQGENFRADVKLGEGETKTAIVDGKMYVDTGSSKKTYTVAEGANFGSVLPELDPEQFEGVAVNEGEERDSFTVTVPAEKVRLMLANLPNASFDLADDSMQINEATLTLYTDKEGKPKSMKLECSVGFSAMGFSINGNVAADYLFLTTGGGVEITPPEDADSYEFIGHAGTLQGAGEAEDQTQEQEP